MKFLILAILSVFFVSVSNAQITSISMKIEDLKEAPFKFKGSRAMMVDRIDDATSKNIFVFSKVKSGSNPDTLFAQKFTKNGEIWKVAQEKAIVYKGIISTWGSRKAFADIDKDGKVDAIFIYSFHDAGMKAQLAVNLLLMYKGNSYTITETADKKNTFSDNYATLPPSLKEYAEKYWANLDKWN